jgi:hypothetical protein
MNEIVGGLFVFLICPALGAIPFQRFRLRSLKLTRQQWLFLTEILQGLIAVGVTKLLFPQNPEWEIIALMGLAAGRFWMRQPGGIWSTIAGYILHDPISGFLVALFGVIGTTMFRQNQQITFALLILMPLMTALRHSRSTILILLTAGLSGVLFGMEQKRPPAQAQTKLKLFRADSLDDALNPDKVGQTAYQLAQLKQQGFPVPIGWLLYPGDDPESLPTEIKPTLNDRWLVRTSFVNPAQPSEVIGDLMSVREIWAVIVQQFELHARSTDQRPMAVIIQPQGAIVYTGVTNCVAPTLKVDIPTEVAEQVLDLIQRLNQVFPEIHSMEWGYDGQQVRVWQVS